MRGKVNFKEITSQEIPLKAINSSYHGYLHSSSRFAKMGYRQTTLERLIRNDEATKFQTRGQPDRF
jgi:hypothetical protein